MLRALLLSTLLFVLPESAAGGSIDFDDLDLSGLSPEYDQLVPDHYRSEGIVFDGPVTVRWVCVSFAGHCEDVFLPGGGTAPNALVLAVFFDPDLDIEGSFVLPGTNRFLVTRSRDKYRC